MLHHVDSAVRVALVLGAALLALPLLRRRSAAARRLVLSCAFVAALLLPFVPAPVRTIHVDAPRMHDFVARVVSEPAVASSSVPGEITSRSTRSVDWLALIWALGALAVFLRSAAGFVMAARIARHATPATGWGHADVRVSKSVQAPAVAGLFSPVILVPACSVDWTEERKRSVLLHELAHVGAFDLQVQALAAIACSLHWFNPLVWLAARRLRLERELAADEAVLRAGLRASTYAEDLLAIAGTAPLGTIAVGTPPLATRIAAIVAPQRPARLGRVGAVALASGTAAMALGVACTNVKPVAAPVASAPPVAALPSPSPRRTEPVVAAESPAPPAPPASPELQKLASSELERTVSTWKAAGGAILVLTPKGEVLAEAGDVDRTIIAGSTMKSLLLATAFEENVVTEADAFESDPGKTARVPELLAKSNNPGFARIFERVGSVKLSRKLLAFHFAMPRTLDANAAIGGTMPASPRQVALAYASLANGGDGVVTEKTASRVTKLLEGVVASEDGTGKKARISGQRIAGKTGTSEWTTDATKHTYASFVGYLPAERPRYVIYVGIESPSGSNPWGGEVAAPVFARLATRALATE